jgi:hypothetical protein
MLDNPNKYGIYPTSKFMSKMEDYCIGLKKQLAEIKEINTNLMAQSTQRLKELRQAQAEIEKLKEANHCLEFESDYQIVDLKAVMWHLKLDYKDLIRVRRKYAEHNKEIAESTKIN